MSEEKSFEAFLKVDLRIGTIIEVHEFPNARKPAYQLVVDFGAIGIKKSSAQITDLYTKEELLHKQVSAVVNFKPRQIANFMSESLVLGDVDEDSVILLKPDLKAKNGLRIS